MEARGPRFPVGRARQRPAELALYAPLAGLIVGLCPRAAAAPAARGGGAVGEEVTRGSPDRFIPDRDSPDSEAPKQEDPAQEAPDRGSAGRDNTVREITVEDHAPLGAEADRAVVKVDAGLPGTATVAEALLRVPGVQVVQLGGLGDFSAVGVRGSSLRQVQVFLDGLPLNPDGAEVINLSALPLRAFERIEVYRGGPPAAFGAAPIGGVVHLVTAEDPPPQARITGGSFGTARADGLAEAELGRARLLGFADVLRTRGDFEVFDDGGTVYNLLDDRVSERINNDKTQLSTLGRLRAPLGRGELGLLQAHLEREEGLPGPAGSPARQPRLQTRRDLSALRVSGRAGAATGQAQLWHQGRMERLTDPADELGLGAGGSELRFDTLGLQLHGGWAAAPTVSLGLTGSGRVDRLDIRTPPDGPPVTRLAGAAALSAEWHLADDRVQLSPVLQGAALQGPDGPTLAFTPRGAIRWSPVPWAALRASGGRSFRPPDFTELFGDRGPIRSNPDLLPERGAMGDLGAALRLPTEGAVRAGLQAAGFRSRVQDHIVFVQNSQQTSIPVNLGDTFTQGLELAVDLGWGPLGTQTAWTWTVSRNLVPRPEVADNQLPRVPTHQLFQATGLRWDRLQLGHELSHTSGTYWDATNFYESPARTLHALVARGRPIAGRGVELELAVRNLTDDRLAVAPRNPLDPADPARVVVPNADFAGYPLPGRSVLVTLHLGPPPGSAP